MKRLFSLIIAAVLCLGAFAQSLQLSVGQVTYSYPAAQAGEMVFAEGTTLTVAGHSFPISTIDSVYTATAEAKDNTVTVAFNGSSATVLVAGNIAPYVDVSVEDARVTITQSSEVGDDTCGEISYLLSGASADGSFTLNGSYKSTVQLCGLSLTSLKGAPLDIENSKRVALSVKNGTENALCDAAGGSQKGCIVCKGHLELKGQGSLTVTSLTGHAIYAKEYVSMKNCTVDVLGAVKDGINCNQYFLLESGTLRINGVGDDGIQVAFKDDTDREDEDTGSILVQGGTLQANITATAAKSLKADGDVLISGGELTLTTSAGAMWDSEKSETKASACISADGCVDISGGTLLLTATGSAGKGISCDGDFKASGGTVTISTSGGLYAYINGVEYTDYTGNTDNINSSLRSSPKGIKCDGNVNITGGDFTITTTGHGAEGIESKNVLTIGGGTFNIHTYDDGLNSSSNLYITGGDLTVFSSTCDAIDSNAGIAISGGVTRAFAPTNSEGGVDASDETGNSVKVTGGTLIAIGGRNSSLGSGSQPYITSSSSVTAGATLSLLSGSTTLLTCDIPSDYSSSGGGFPFSPFGAMYAGGGNTKPGGSSGSGIIISCPGMVSGSTYTLSIGTSTSSVTAK
ncbi:MAG: carbohydrate-binding domain-containing protein [Prevotella sp.]